MKILLTILALSAFVTGAIRAAEPPNIIVILADDFGWGDIGVQGSEVPTPGIDRMAAEGTRFTKFYVASPICSPSRAALITGLFPGRAKITSFLQTRKGNAACEQADFLDPALPSLPRTLKAAGYATAHIGKWHLGGGRDVRDAPKFAAYGYDLGLGTWESPEPSPDLTATNWIWSPEDNVKRWDRTRWMVDRALDFLNSNPDRPVFVNLWLDDTHTPWVPNDAADPKANSPEQFRGVLTEVDRQIDRLLNVLRERKGRETLVLFLGDNGAMPTFAQKRTGGLRGSKLSLYEGGVRVPFIAWRPGVVPAGRVDHETVLAAVDLFPTLSAVAGISSPEEGDGQNLIEAFSGKSVSRARPLFWEYGRNNKSFSFPKGKNRSPNLAVRDGKWKLLIQGDGSRAELYDLEANPTETENLAEKHPDVTARLSSAVLEWRKSLP